jgi:hypothetical protein
MVSHRDAAVWEGYNNGRGLLKKQATVVATAVMTNTRLSKRGVLKQRTQNASS